MNRMAIGMMIVASLSLIGCGLFIGIEGSGNVISEDRDIDSEFSTIKLTNHVDIYVTIGDKVSLSLKGDDNLIPHVITRVSGNKLTIRSDKKLRKGYRTRKGLKAYLTVRKGQLKTIESTSHGDIILPELTGKDLFVEMSSHGDIEIDRIEGTDVTFELSSHGDLKIGYVKIENLDVDLSSHGDLFINDGEAVNQRISLSSHGDYMAKKMASDTCHIQINSHGTAKLWVKKMLKGKVSGHGNLFYRGEPKLEIRKSSHGKIHSVD